MKLTTRLYRIFRGIFDRAGLAQEMTVARGEKYCAEGMAALCRQTAAEGTVLLKNDGVLPLKGGVKIAVFGRCQLDYFCVGYGSGGDVKAPYKASFADGMKCAEERGDIVCDKALYDIYSAWTSTPRHEKDDGFWGHWPMCYPEMPIKDDIAREAAKHSDVAVVVIGRAAGEDRENKLKKGSYFLTDCERDMLAKVTSVFKKTVVVMDCGNIVDLGFTEEYNISALVYAWLGGMEAGNGVWDVLTGAVNPCGKLTDTIAKKHNYYPSSGNFGGKAFNNYCEDIYVGYRYFETFARDDVLYPFGYGLSYTQFGISVESFKRTASDCQLIVKVKNVGGCAGKEVVQVYASCPQGRLGKPEKVLVAFRKTRLLSAGEVQTLSFSIDNYAFASYDDFRNICVLEEGAYSLSVGCDVRNVQTAGVFSLDKEVVISRHSPVCKVKNPFDRLVNRGGKKYERVAVADYDLRDRIVSAMPSEVGFKGDKGYKLADVAEGKISLDEFISQLSNEELEALSRGKGEMNAEEGTDGNAGGYGGTIPSLKDKGVPVIVTCDGPSGLRLNRFASLLPCGTAIASTWNTELAEELYSAVNAEMVHYGVDTVLGPGMNIHRNPLCGRNFEYYSEDPYLTGKMGAAAVKGIQRNRKSACIKHFACNNQEVKRNTNDSRVSERALREIYLKGFEICVKEARPLNIMVSYNKINGVWAHYNYDLTKTLARGEWGFDGVFITDWWMQKSTSPEYPVLRTNAYRVRSGVDVLMPGNMSRLSHGYVSDGTTLESIGKEGGITRGELEYVAKNVLSYIIKVKLK